MDPAFDRAFVAASYLLGVRELTVEGWSLGDDARQLVRVLESPDRDTRATVLAREVLRIANALERGSLG